MGKTRDSILVKIQKFGVENSLFCLTINSYVNKLTRLRWSCLSCGMEFKRSWEHMRDSYNKGRGLCPLCGGGRAYDRDIYEMDKYLWKFGFRVNNRELHRYRGVDKVSSVVKISVTCNHNHVTKVPFSELRRVGGRCHICNPKGEGRKYNPKWVMSEVPKIAQGYIAFDDYKDGRVTVMCDQGHVYNVDYYNFKRGSRCQQCYGKNVKFTIDQVKSDVRNTAQGYECLSDAYVDIQTPLWFSCSFKHKYRATYANFRTGSRCPRCQASRGENMIRYILTRELPDSYLFKEQHPRPS